MKFSKDPVSPVAIRHVSRGAIKIGADEFAVDFAITADGDVLEFAMPEIDKLGEEHLRALLETDPEMIIVGSGWSAAFAPRDLVFALARRGIGLEFMDTPAACRTFNILVNEGRRPAAVIKVR
jgi:uncharacterized protein